MDADSQNSGGWSSFLGGLVSGATAAFTSQQQTEAERARLAAAQYQTAATAQQSGNLTKIALIGGGVLAVVAVLFLVFKK